MKTFQQFQEDISKLPKLPGLGGGGGGTDSITGKSSAKSLKKRVIDAGKMATVPARFLLNIKSKPDPTEKFADSRMTPKEKVTSAISDYKKKQKKVNEGVASLAVKGGSKLIPALVTGIGAAGTIMQSKKKDKDVNITPRGLKNLENAVFRGKTGRKLDAEILKRREQKEKMKGVIKPKETEIAKQKELVSKAEKEVTKPKSGEKKEASKTLKDFLKARKIEGRTMMKIKQDTDISKKGPGDQLPNARRDYLNKLLKNLRKEEVAIANSMGGGGIAGSVEAGHEPPVNKRKKKGEPTIMARGLLPGARTRFKTGADLLTNLKKNKYT